MIYKGILYLGDAPVGGNLCRRVFGRHIMAIFIRHFFDTLFPGGYTQVERSFDPYLSSRRPGVLSFAGSLSLFLAILLWLVTLNPIPSLHD